MATSIIKLHTLSGAGDGGPPCFILQVDEFHCLLDCGWPGSLDSEYVNSVSLCARRIDAVLLSHQGLRHLGLLPYLVGSCGLKCPVYATTPVYKMGQLTLYDFHQSVYATQDFNAFTLDDIDAAFDLVIQVKYHQTINLLGRGRGLCVTPLPSGHTLGGTIWKMVKEDTDIVYAVDFNHKKERHLNGATFDACMRPHLLILDGSNVLHSHPRRKDRDESLRQCILKSLRRGGNVLVAVDTAGRCLEIAHFLEQCWLNQDSGMMAYGLAMLSHVAFNVVDFAKSMIEWMSEKVMRTFEDQRSNPFHFRHLQLCHTLEQLDSVPEPKVVLASSFDMEYGFARQLFAEWADSDLNTVILTSREPSCCIHPDVDEPTLLMRLIGLAQGEPDARSGLPTSSTGTLVLPLSLSQRVSTSQLEHMENQIPRIRNAVRADSQSSHTPQVDVLDNPGFLPDAQPASDIQPPNEEHTAFPDESTLTEVIRSSFGLTNGQSSSTPNLTGNPATLEHSTDKDGSSSKSPFVLTTASASHSDHDAGLFLSANNRVVDGHLGIGKIKKTDFTHTAMTASSNLTSGRHQPGYDIYPGLHNHAGGQFFRMAKRTQLLFPLTDKKIQWDEYGSHLDRELFATNENPEPTTYGAIIGSKPKNEKPHQPAVVETPPSSLISSSILECLASKTWQFDDPEAKTHVVTHRLEIPLRCELFFLDFEGKSDGEAIKRIVLGVRPPEVILVGNDRLAVDHLATYFLTAMLLSSDLVHTPQSGEVVNCTKEGDIYQARMKDSLVSSLKFTKIRDYELAWVDAVVSLDDLQDLGSAKNPSENSDSEMTQTEDKATGVEPKPRVPLMADQLPVLNLPSGPIGVHDTVFVNEPKLSDLKQLLLAQGLVAEFVSGVLVVDNCVAVKRSEAGKLLLEGLLSRTYFDVRNILYQQFAIL